MNRLILVVLAVTLLAGCSFEKKAERSITDSAPDQIEPINAPFSMPQFKRPVFPDRVFDIREFGAVEGVEVLNTVSIQKAVEACSEAGGGKVLIPAGKWFTGAIHLRSNVNLHIAEGALVLFSDDLKDYLPEVFSRHEGLECMKPSALIYAYECDNIAITGTGRLHGQGLSWQGDRETRKKMLNGKVVTDGGDRLRELCEQNVPSRQRHFGGGEGDFLRPSFVSPVRCTNVFIEGVTLLYGPMWTVHPIYCENVVIRKVKVTTEGEYGHIGNGDGCNPDSCRNVLIEYCDMDTGDDCFTIKSGRADDGLRVGIPCENVVIRHGQGRQGHGGVVIGSETSGGIRNIFIRDCVFNGTDRGIRLKTARGRGSVIENVWVQDVEMGEILKEAIIVNTLRYTERYPAHPLSEKTPTYRNLNFKNITCAYAHQAAIRIIGLPEKPMSGLRFENISVKAAQGLRIQDAGDIEFENINIVPDEGPILHLDQCFDVKVSRLDYPEKADALIELIGEQTRNITLQDMKTTPGQNDIIYGEKVSDNAVTIQ